MIVVEERVFLLGLSPAVQRIVDAPHLDEKLSAGLDRAVHGQQQHPLLLLVDGVDGKAAVCIVIAGRPVDGGVDKVPAEEARVVSAPLPQRLNGRV